VTYTASIAVGDDLEAALAGLGEDLVLGDRSFDLHEDAPGRWTLIVYFDNAPDAAERRALTELAASFGSVTPVIEALPETDWVKASLAELPPVRAGRFMVHGSHHRDALKPNDIGLEIEAAQAFGTGHHGTTAGCLLAIERIARQKPIRSALDIGTGSGVLAIAIAKLCKARVLASDIDPLAARIARENARLNGVVPYVEVVTAAGVTGRQFDARAPYDLIVANILAGPLVALAPAIHRLIAAGGRIILSGLLPEQRARIVSAYRGQGLRLARSTVLDGWLTMEFAAP
jgi:ribosomal protein L11 methyltransferase